MNETEYELQDASDEEFASAVKEDVALLKLIESLKEEHDLGQPAGALDCAEDPAIQQKMPEVDLGDDLTKAANNPLLEEDLVLPGSGSEVDLNDPMGLIRDEDREAFR
jgi:hypothetical protein